MKKDLTLTNFLNITYISYFRMGKLDYIRENIGALTSGTIYSGLWTAVLESHWPNTYVAGMAIANFGFGFYGYNLLKESEKRKENFGKRNLLGETELSDLITKAEIPPKLD